MANGLGSRSSNLYNIGSITKASSVESGREKGSPESWLKKCNVSHATRYIWYIDPAQDRSRLPPSFHRPFNI